ncbi:MAG: Na+/H+ antiporter subunit E [Patescibacteria group bacterium]|nr:Na+/H+ antiporter subunit E [Patescibacteria group bacterium]
MLARVRTAHLLLMGAWLIMVGQVGIPSLLLGLLAVILATTVFGKVFLPGASSHSVPDLLVRAVAICRLLPIFLLEALRAALSLAWMAVQPTLSFKSGIVCVPTTLKNRSAITLLANLITLSPGTLTIAFDFDEGCYYIHCIDVRGIDGEAGRRSLIARFEEPLRRIFE